MIRFVAAGMMAALVLPLPVQAQSPGGSGSVSSPAVGSGGASGSPGTVGSGSSFGTTGAGSGSPSSMTDTGLGSSPGTTGPGSSFGTTGTDPAFGTIGAGSSVGTDGAFDSPLTPLDDNTGIGSTSDVLRATEGSSTIGPIDAGAIARSGDVGAASAIGGIGSDLGSLDFTPPPIINIPAPRIGVDLGAIRNALASGSTATPKPNGD